MKLAPAASLYSACAALMSICCKYHLVDGLRRSKVTLSYRAASKGKEYWRLGTSLLLFDLDTPLDVYTLVVLFTTLSTLERRYFPGAPGSMVTAILFMAALLLAPGFYFRELRLKEPSVMLFIAVITWASVRTFGPSSKSSFFASLVPLVPIVAPHFQNEAVDVALLKRQGMAVAVGLASVVLIPDPERERASRKSRQLQAKNNARLIAQHGRAGSAAADAIKTSKVANHDGDDDDASSEEDDKVEIVNSSEDEDEDEQDG